MEQVELETYYPKLMLEQRMNPNVSFREGNLELDDNDFEFDLDAQLTDLTTVNEMEKERLG